MTAAGNDPVAAAYVAEHRPLILLAQGRKEGAAELLKVVDDEGGRASRLRIAAAATLHKQGDDKAAAALLEGDEAPIAAARRLLEAGQAIPGAIRGDKAGVAEFLIPIAVALHLQHVTPHPLTPPRLSPSLPP